MNYLILLREFCHGKSHFQSEEMGKIPMIVTIQSIEHYVRLKIIQNQQSCCKDLMFLSPFQLPVKKMSVLLCCFINSQNSELMDLTKQSKVRKFFAILHDNIHMMVNESHVAIETEMNLTYIFSFFLLSLGGYELKIPSIFHYVCFSG